MPKFQAKYIIQLNLDETKKRASALGYDVKRSGGRPEKASQQAEGARAQLVIKITQNQTTVQVSRNTTLIFWAGEYQKIDEIERILEDILEPKHQGSLKSLRISVPSIIEEQMKNTLLYKAWEQQKEITEKEKQIVKLEILLKLVKGRIDEDFEDMSRDPELKAIFDAIRVYEAQKHPKQGGEMRTLDTKEVIKRAFNLLLHNSE